MAANVVQELRFYLCQSSAGSRGLREFVKKNYSKIKTSNPKLPVLVREAHGTNAAVVARFGFGEERKLSLNGLEASEVETKFTNLLQNKL